VAAILLAGVIVAATAVSGYRTRARHRQVAEAVAGLAAIRRTERVQFAENNAYLPVAPGAIQHDPADARPGLGLDFKDNSYFDGNCFSVAADKAFGFIATCDGAAPGNAAPEAAAAAGIRAEMRSSGEARFSHDGGSSWTEWK